MEAAIYIPFLFLIACTGSEAEKDNDTTESTETSPESTMTNTDSGTETETETETETMLLEEGFHLSLTNSSACSDTFFQAWNENDNIGLAFYIPNILQSVLDNGPQTISYQLEDEEINLSVSIAENISINYCTDDLDDLIIENIFHAISGKVTASAESSGGTIGEGGTGGFVLENVVLQDEEGNQQIIDFFQHEDIDIDGSWGG